jgi:hypothetical protein
MRALIIAIIFARSINAQKVTLDRSFGEGLPDMQMTADGVSEIVEKRFGAKPLLHLPIYCHFEPWRPSPITILSGGQIDIYLTVAERRWDQFAFQLGHELGHVMLGPQRTNGIIETICYALSYEVLDALGEKWSSGAFLINRVRFVAYAPNFKIYKENDQRLTMANFPKEIGDLVAKHRWLELSRYLHTHESESEDISPAGAVGQRARNIQALGAIAIRSGAITWKSFLGLANCTTPLPKQKPEFLVAPTRPECLLRLSSTLCRIGVDCRGYKR